MVTYINENQWTVQCHRVGDKYFAMTSHYSIAIYILTTRVCLVILIVDVIQINWLSCQMFGISLQALDQWFSNSSPPSLSIRPARLCCLFIFLIIFMWQYYETCLNLITFCVHTTVIKVMAVRLNWLSNKIQWVLSRVYLFYFILCLWLHWLLSFRYVLKHMGLKWLQ